MLLYILVLLPFVMFGYMVIDFSIIEKQAAENRNAETRKIIEARRREREAETKKEVKT